MLQHIYAIWAANSGIRGAVNDKIGSRRTESRSVSALPTARESIIPERRVGGQIRTVVASFQAYCQGMLWLVQTNRATTGKPQLSNRTPSCFLNFRTLNVFPGQCTHLRFQVVANEIEFLGALLVGRMECGLSWR